MVGSEIKLWSHAQGEYKNQIIIVHIPIMEQNKQNYYGAPGIQGSCDTGH